MWKVRILFATSILNCILIEMTTAYYSVPQWRKKESRNSKLPPCDSNKLIDFLAEVQVINPESIIKQATLNDLEPLCKKINKGLESTHSYLKHCEPQLQKDLYLRLIKGVDSLHDKLCKKNGDFMEAFKKYHPCCHKTNYNNCTGPADWVEDSNATKICSAYKEISNCYYKTTLQHCGEEAGKTIQELFDAVVVSILTVNCGISSKGNNQTATSGKEINASSITCLCILQFCTIILKKLFIP